MPWVVQDYESDELDLDNPATFRDLSKPIGALEPNRLRSVTKRYEEMVSLNDPEMPPFMWGSHYSTSGYVLYYLAREAPDLMLKLQSGNFDKPDRLFSSISRAWKGVLENPMDVKELIPEFYRPASSAFLTNHRGIDWGVKQDGTAVGDVELPPWAFDSDDFVEKLAEALECDYVSQHLHEWIDLIFGHKQRGEAAVAAGNLFRHLSYEGAIDIRTVTDPHERAATLTQIVRCTAAKPWAVHLAAHGCVALPSA
jgi:factor associated with neutral sphingomyelinase activation